MSDLPSRLREARSKAGFKSARSAALRFGWRPSTYAAHENGQNSFDAGQAVIYAKAFKAEAGWLYFGVGKQLQETGGYVYNPAGYVYDQGAVSMILKSLDEKIPAYSFFTQMPLDIQVFEIIDESLWPKYNISDLLICRLSENLESNKFIGSESIVEIEDGRILLRQIEAATDPAKFNLVSQKLPLIRSAVVKRAWTKLATVARAGYGYGLMPVEEGKFQRLEDSLHVALQRDTLGD